MLNKENFIPEFIEILTTDGWIEIGKFNFKLPLLTILEDKAEYMSPKMFSHYIYEGELIEITTEKYSIFLNPSSCLLVNQTTQEVSKIKKGDKLDKYYLYQETVQVKKDEWQGRVFSLQFNQSVLLPIKFEGDYSLLVI